MAFWGAFWLTLMGLAVVAAVFYQSGPADVPKESTQVPAGNASAPASGAATQAGAGHNASAPNATAPAMPTAVPP